MSQAGSAAAAGDTGAADAAAAAAAAASGAQTPWYDSLKTDAEFVGTLQTRGLDKKDALAAAHDFYKGHREAQQMISRLTGTPDKDRILIQPKPDATDQEKAAFYERLGRPTKPEEYDFKAIKFPDGTELDDDFAGFLRATAFKANMSKDAADALARETVTYLNKVDEADAAKTAFEVNEAIKKLNESWGANRQAFQFIADQGLQKLAEKAGLDPAQTKTALEAMAKSIGRFETAQLMLAMGKITGEDKYIAGPQGSNTGLLTREQAQAKLTELKMDGNFYKNMIYKDGKPVSKEAREFEALTAMMVGQEQ